ncbi:MAG: hypothetical protein C5B59_07925 [Bacteroidetes bacterium]|nr:MAG: hypothetical protein C5B59_07925 [Bacteroidota bacterium]
MPSAIVKGATGQPGPVAYSTGLTTGVFNDLNFVIPDYIPGLVAKYGNSSYLLASEILGNTNIEQVNTSTQTYSHFEKGRPYGSGIVAATVASGAAGSNVTVTLKAPDSYNNAAFTQSPFLVNQTVKIRSNGRKCQVVTVTPTQGAFTLVLKPLGNYQVATGTGSSILQGEGLETFGNQLAGEASDSQGTQQQKLYRYDNTATVLRASVKASDLAGMNKTQIDFGNNEFYLPTLAVKEMNMQMIVNIEDAVMEGVPYSNTTNTGTVGVMPDVTNRGGEVDYVVRNFQIWDFQNFTNVLDANGGPREYHFLQALTQRQDINNLLFGIYRNGAISYASVGFSQEAAVTYGFSGFSTDTFDFHFHRYKGFTPQSIFGYTPSQGDYRADFGLGVPQGDTVDAKDNTTRPYLQWVYQQNPDIPAGLRIYSWDLGYTKNTKTTVAANFYEEIAYVGSRVIAAEQFNVLKGLQV